MKKSLLILIWLVAAIGAESALAQARPQGSRIFPGTDTEQNRVDNP